MMIDPLRNDIRDQTGEARNIRNPRKRLREDFLTSVQHSSTITKTEPESSLRDLIQRICLIFIKKAPIPKLIELQEIMTSKFGLHRVDSSVAAIETIFKTVGSRHCINLFKDKKLLFDGIQLLANLIHHEEDTLFQDCSKTIAAVMEASLERVKSIVEAFDHTNAHILCQISTMSYQMLTTHPVGDFLISLITHTSMHRRFDEYLQDYGEQFWLGKHAKASNSNCLAVYCFFDILESAVGFDETCRYLPFLFRHFVEKVPCSELDIGAQNHFLVFVKLMKLLLESQAKIKNEIIVELLECLKSMKLYQPLSDHNQLQLGFLKELIQFVFSKSEHQYHKKRKVGNRNLDFKWKVSWMMLDIEHRALLPHLKEIFYMIQVQDSPDQIFLSFLRKFSAARQLNLFLAIMSSAFGVKCLQEQTVHNISTEVRKLSSTEGLALIKTLSEIPTTEFNLSVLIRVIFALSVSESSALETATVLNQMAPSLQVLKEQNQKNKELYLLLLDLRLQIEKCLMQCSKRNPAISHTIVEVESLESQPYHTFVELLVLRLEQLYQQNFERHLEINTDSSLESKAHEVFHKIGSLFPLMDHEVQSWLEGRFLTYSFLPFLYYGSKERIISVLRKAIRHKPDKIKSYFDDAQIFTLPEFKSYFLDAFFAEIVNLAPSEALQQICAIDVSTEEKYKSVKHQLRKKLKQSSRAQKFEASAESVFLQWLHFALQLPVQFFAGYRILLEMATLHYSTMETVVDPLTVLKCLALFSAETQIHYERADYLKYAIFHVFYLCRSLSHNFENYVMLQASESALFSILKQLFCEQCTKQNLRFFHSNTATLLNEKPWTGDKITAMDILRFLMKFDKQEMVVMATVGVLVHFCIWLCQRRGQKKLKSLLGVAPKSWSATIYQKFKRSDAFPDLTQITLLMKNVVIPWINDLLKMEQSLTGLQQNILAGLISDVLCLVGPSEGSDLESSICQMLKMTQTILKERILVPDESQRIVCFIHRVVLVTKVGEDEDLHRGMLHLHFDLFKTFGQAISSPSDPCSAPLTDAKTTPLIVQDSASGRCFAHLMMSFNTFLEHSAHHEIVRTIGEHLLARLKDTHQLEEKFAALQCMAVLLSQSSVHDQYREHSLEEIYECFWDHHFRHVLPALIGGKNKKKVEIPLPHEREIFSAALIGYYRCFSECCATSRRLNQRLICQMLSKTRRILRILFAHTVVVKLPQAAGWYLEICYFLKQILRNEKFSTVDKNMVSWIESVLAMLLQILIVWEIESAQLDNLHQKIELELGMVFSEFVIQPLWKNVLPNVLAIFFATVQRVKSGKFSRRSPLSVFFKKRKCEVDLSKLLNRLQGKVSRIVAKLNSSDKKRIVGLLQKDDNSTKQLESCIEQNQRYCGYDG